ncbi:multicopper oxidase [Aulographum hederae CBS 113979]|uniref:Multicopper oxidase n=1 Tax=Aulographum hederae CBS 113979 TaxID=1176131 RepID=A0A6G1HDY7_9PEZI|nr:multicopper oxidase [Aulographum hederae CBS 113979]
MSRFLVLLAAASSVIADTKTFNWDITWVNAAPDGYTRPVIGVNNQWPCPTLEANVGDEIIVNVKNSLGNQSTGLHWHGQWQKGTPHMDGTPQVAQCPIPDGESFTYKYTAAQSGTHWWHSHAEAQYPDGIRAPMIVHDRSYEGPLGVAKQFVMTVSDWYHEQDPWIVHKLLTNSGGPPPEVDASLMNDKQSDTFQVQPGKKYLFRFLSISAFLAHSIKIDGHDMTITALDGVPCNPKTVDSLIIAPGQRYDVVIQTKRSTNRNYAIHSKLMGTRFSNTGVLSYNPRNAAPGGLPDPIVLLDDMSITPKDGQKRLPPSDHKITMDVTYRDLPGNMRRIYLGNDTYLKADVPTLYTALTTGNAALNPIVYGSAVNPSVIRSGETVDIIVNNKDEFAHPMHLHGHVFQVLARGPGDWNGDESQFPETPMKRDTVTTIPGGHLVIRFTADNPGAWLFHCHMEWHVAAGMVATIIESPDLLQQARPYIPGDHYAICRDKRIPTQGNCAGKTRNVLDTRDCHNEPEYSDTWGALEVEDVPGGSGGGHKSRGRGRRGRA